MTDKPKFELGQVVATPGCIEALDRARQTPPELLAHHLRLERGELCDDDHHANEMSLIDGSRILSAFRLDKKYLGGVRFVLLEDVGKPVIVDGIATEELGSLLGALGASA